MIWLCFATIGTCYAMSETPSLHDYWKVYFDKDYLDTFEFYFNLAQSISLCVLVFLSGFIGMICDMYPNGLIIIV